MKEHHIPKDSIITVAGTVGVGKSTLTRTLAKRLGFKTSLEEVDHNPYLEKFYHDFERWSFHLQIYFLAERFKEQKIYLKPAAGLCKTVLFMKIQGFLQKCTLIKGPCQRSIIKRIQAFLKPW